MEAIPATERPDRLQPSLLDRLTDESPQEAGEPRAQRGRPLRQLRAAVLRDLGWLLNSAGVGAVQDLSGFPLAARSVLNFGVGDLSGRTASSIDTARLERRVRQAIRDFEPRILPDSVVVRTIAGSRSPGNPGNRLTLQIEGALWTRTVPKRLCLKTEIDLEAGEVRIADGDAAA